MSSIDERNFIYRLSFSTNSNQSKSAGFLQAEPLPEAARPGYLRLNGSELSFKQNDSPAFVGRRQTALNMEASTKMEFTPTAENEEAGLFHLSFVFFHKFKPVEIGRILAG